MSHSSKIFDRQPIKVQNLNGFDLSHLNTGTAYCGTLTPVLCKLLMPGTKFSLGCAVNVELPPLAAPFFGRVDAHIECFWVNCSILYGGWKQFISNNPETSFTTAQGNIQYDLPYVLVGGASVGGVMYTIGQLYSTNDCVLDYLGVYPGYGQTTVSPNTKLNMLPLLAYHLIWNSFYRNPQVTRTIFAVNPDTTDVGFAHNVAYVHHSYYRAGTSSSPSGSSPSFGSLADLTFPDGINIFQMRQRNYGNDYFTAGSLKPQQGNPSALSFTVDLNSGDGEFTIAALRAANSLQKFMEVNNYDPTYRGIMRANFGVTPGDADMDEPIYLGRLVIPVYQKTVYNNTVAGGGNADSPNPFVNATWSDANPGARAGNASASNEGEIVSNFKVSSFGYVIGLFSLVPHAQYSYGINRHMLDLNIGDYPFPMLQSVGMDSVKDYEVFYNGANSLVNTDFSYVPRYSRMKYIDDTVHGDLRPGGHLKSFVLQRDFTSSPAFSTSFLEIAKSDLDNFFAADSSTMHFSCWYEIYWVFKAVMPLAEFCVPTLGELQDTHNINVKQGGSRL